jgi:flagellar basal-body rod protein FlgB
MLPGILSSSTLPVLEQVVGYTQARHNVLAGNIANVDTPGYHASDLSPEKFSESLKEYVDAKHSGTLNPSTANLFHSESLAGPAARDWNTLLRHDDSDISLENQVAEISKNQMQHNLAISIMTSQFKLLQAAVSERV